MMEVQLTHRPTYLACLFLVIHILSLRESGTLADYKDAPGLLIKRTRSSDNENETQFMCEAQDNPISTEPYLPSKIPIFSCNCYYKLHEVECPEWIQLTVTPDYTLRNENMKGEGYCVARLKYNFPNSSLINRGGTVAVHTKCEQSQVDYKSEEYVIKIKKAGNQEYCYRDEDCYVQGQQCSGEEKCYCSPLWAAFSEEHGCLPYSQLDGSCEQDIQCRFAPNSNCSERKICECGPSFEKRDKFCLLPIPDANTGGGTLLWLIPLLVMLGILFLGGVVIAIYKWRANVNRHHPVPVST